MLCLAKPKKWQCQYLYRNVTSKIIEFCKRTIPNKMITIRPLDLPWINNEIRTIIRKRKRAHKPAKKWTHQTIGNNFQNSKNKSISALSVAKHEYKIKLSEKITSGKFSSKDWWKTIKSLLGMDKMEDIPSLIQIRQPINDLNDKASTFNRYFQSQTVLDDSSIPVPELPQSIFSCFQLNLASKALWILLSLSKHVVLIKVRKTTKIRKRYNQVQHLIHDTAWESNKNTINITNKSQEVSPFSEGEHKAAMNRRESMRNTRLKKHTWSTKEY